MTHRNMFAYLLYIIIDSAPGQLELQIVSHLPWHNLTTILTKLLLKMNQSKAMLCWRHLESTQEFAPHLWTEFTESIDVVGARKNRIESAQNISDVLEVSAVKDDDECCTHRVWRMEATLFKKVDKQCEWSVFYSDIASH